MRFGLVGYCVLLILRLMLGCCVVNSVDWLCGLYFLGLCYCLLDLLVVCYLCGLEFVCC